VSVSCIGLDETLRFVGYFGWLDLGNYLAERSDTVETDRRSSDAQIVETIKCNLRLVDLRQGNVSRWEFGELIFNIFEAL
jgi:hypothetical protein